MKLNLRTYASSLALLIFVAGPARSTPVNDLVEEWLLGTYQLDPSTHEIEFLATTLSSAEASADQLSLRALTESEPQGLFTLLAEIDSGGTLVARGQIRLRIRKYAEVLVSSDRISRHDIPDRGQFELKRTEVTSLREQPMTSFEELNGLRMKRNLSKGKILTSGAVEPVPDIEVGQEVAIVFSDGLCTISAPGRSMQSGRTGDNVRVKNTATGKIVTARVVDGRSVAVGP
jgi:flagella basal body P-ring formation protein FlgA